MIRYPVIDKSYLQGAAPSDIHKLCSAGAIMSDTLFAELVTATPEECRRCFGKFPIGPNPINMIPSVGFLLPPMPKFSPLRPAQIDENWIWFRTLQAQLLAALEFVRKNGAGALGQQSQSVEHDLLDAEYVALGALSGALASRDKTLQR